MPNQPDQFLLYGATGYTAGLIIDLAAEFGLQPILAGRDKLRLYELGRKRNLPQRVADLNDPAALDALLQDVPLVLHCAGPFSQTALPMQQACLRAGVDYLDITGEITVFERGMTLHDEAVARNVMLLSGVGFDVVPTDCLALSLKNQLPDATHLKLAFANVGGSISHGTAQTMLESLGTGGLIRENGQIKAVPDAYQIETVVFAPGVEMTCMSIPWGDVSTAYQTTGIPNITTFLRVPTRQIRLARLGRNLGWLLKRNWLRRLLRELISGGITGPDAHTRQTAQTLIWGQVHNAAGQTKTARLRCPEGYLLTALTALTITQRVLNGERKPGYQTPAGLFGPDLILDIEGVSRIPD